VEIDWPGLRAAATEVAGRAYAPYSRLRVGAAGQTPDGRSSWAAMWRMPPTAHLMRECGLVSALHAAGGGTFVAVSVWRRTGEPLLPCGRCRQLLLETAGPGLLVDTGSGPRALADCCPGHLPSMTSIPGEAAMHDPAPHGTIRTTPCGTTPSS